MSIMNFQVTRVYLCTKYIYELLSCRSNQFARQTMAGKCCIQSNIPCMANLQLPNSIV